MWAPEQSDFDEVRLWQQIVAGDVPGFERWHERYAPRLLLFLRNRCRPPVDPEDLAQLVWLRVWERRTQWNPELGQFANWLFRVASNELNSQLRRRQSRPEQAFSEGADPVAREHTGDDPRLAAFRECLAELGGKFVEILKLRLAENLEDTQIAEQLGITVATVYTRASRGRDEVRQCVERKSS